MQRIKEATNKRYGGNNVKFNQELITALAHGNAQAFEQIKNLPSVTRMSIGLEVDKLRQEKNIVPMNNSLSIYAEQKKSSYTNAEDIGRVLAANIKAEKEREEEKERVRHEQLKKEVEYKVSRARIGLPY